MPTTGRSKGTSALGANRGRRDRQPALAVLVAAPAEARCPVLSKAQVWYAPLSMASMSAGKVRRRPGSSASSSASSPVPSWPPELEPQQEKVSPPRRAHTCPSPALSCSTPGHRARRRGPLDDPARPRQDAAVVVAPAAQLRGAVVHQDGHRGRDQGTRARPAPAPPSAAETTAAAGRASSEDALDPQQWVPAGFTPQKAALPPARSVTPRSGGRPPAPPAPGRSGPVPRSPQQWTPCRSSSSAQAAWIPTVSSPRPLGQIDEHRRGHHRQRRADEGPVPPAGDPPVAVNRAGVDRAGGDAGSVHTCALHRDGRVSCWGHGPFMGPGCQS